MPSPVTKRLTSDPDGDDFQYDNWPFYWLTQVVGRYLQHLEVGLKRIGLDVPRWRVLMCLSQDRAVSVSEVAERAIVKLPTMTKIVQRMAEDGLVTCSVSEVDARVTVVTLTGPGLQARHEAWHIAAMVYDRAFARIPKGKIAALNLTLEAVFDRLGP